jgi:hypothetical protein
MAPALTMDVPALVKEMAEKSGLSEEDVHARMNEKITKFSGLLTEQGALVLLSRELNVKLPLFDKPNAKLKLGELKMGMNNVDVEARVKYADNVKTYSKNGKEGKYLSTRLTDETGEALFTFWNEQADEAMAKGIRVGSKMTLTNARVGSFNQMTQLSLGYNGIYSLENDETNENSATPTREGQTIQPMEKNSAKLSELTEGQFIETTAHVVDVLPGKGYYVRCLACNAKLQKRENTCPICMKEGKIDTRLLVTMVIDDGSKPMRAVAFENEVAALYGKNKDELLNVFEANKPGADNELLGKVVRIQGKGKMGMDRISLELVISKINSVPFANA